MSGRLECTGSKNIDLEYCSNSSHLKFSPACSDFGAQTLLKLATFNLLEKVNVGRAFTSPMIFKITKVI